MAEAKKLPSYLPSDHHGDDKFYDENEQLWHTSPRSPWEPATMKETTAYACDDIRPCDSVSRAGSRHSSQSGRSRTSTKSSRSARSERAAAITKEIELAAQAAILKKRYELEKEREEIERKIEMEEFAARQRRRERESHKAELDYKREEMIIQANLEAAKAISQVYDSECGSIGSHVSAAESVTRAIITRAEEIRKQKPTSESLQHVNTDCDPYDVKVEVHTSPENQPVKVKVDKTDYYVQPVDTGAPHQHEDERMPTIGNKEINTTSTQVVDSNTETQIEDTCEEAGTHKKLEDPLVTLLDKLVEFHKESTLPTPDIDPFDGVDLLEFPTFMKNFQMLVEEGTTNPKRRLELLLKFTKGEAYQRIKDCVLLKDPKQAYDSAMNLLQKDYGDPIILASAYKARAKDWSQIGGGDTAGLRKFAVFVNNCCIAKQASTDLYTMDGHEFLHMLARKLPIPLQQQWIVRVGKLRDSDQRSPKLEDFRDFISQLSRNENDPRIKGLGYQGRSGKSKPVHGAAKKQAFATTVVKNGPNPKVNKASVSPCLYCGDGTKHALLECRKFAALSLNEKSEACKRKGLCFGCVNKGHMKKTCPNKEWAKCTKCTRNHPTILHDPTRDTKAQPSPENTSEPPPKVTTGCVGVTNEICAKTSTNEPAPLMTIIPVLVKAAAGSQYVSTYAFMDNGCGAVFADSELQSVMKTKVRSTKLLLKTMNLEEMFDIDVMIDDLQVGNIEGNSFIDLPSVFIKDSIPVTMDDAPTQEDLDRWEHLRHIRLPQLKGHCIPRVTLMIGSKVPAATTPLETAYGKLGDPYALRTPLGWLVYGLPGKMRNQSEVSVNFCRIDSLTVQTSTEQLEEQFQKYINMDFNERLDSASLSVEDRKFLAIMEESTKKIDGYYQTKLPWRNQDDSMPNNHLQAIQYANSLKRRLLKDEQLHKNYADFMVDLETKGYAEKIPEEERGHPGKVWYIPHHSVVHPKKPDKTRVVFNCPATYQGKSLNSQLLQGPDLTNRLLGILLRWRQENIGVMADIQEMFYQVRVQESDCDMLRFVWWVNGDLDNELEEYRMLVHVFGAVSSPSCANYILRKTALDGELKYGTEVTNAILTDFYVDDFLRSFEKEDVAIEMVHKIKECLAEGGFRLHKWISNSKKVFKSIPIEERSKEVKTLDLHSDSLPTERALGLQWNVEEDTLGFTTSEVNKKATRRRILSVMSSIYDPLGFVAPFTLRAKIILQELCREQVSWDEEIPKKYKQQWESWLQEFSKLKNLKIDRCYKPCEFEDLTNVEIHHFTDASEAGYGVVSYIRYVNSCGRVHCAFLMGKARVAPVKIVTIPRLELSAATTAVKINHTLEKELQIPVNAIHYWTDSQTVLRYIHSTKCRFQTFVANRVETIRGGSQPRQWHYVKSEQNPADYASRGLTMTDLLKTPSWLQGPQFLWSKDSNWPTWSMSEKSTQSMEGDPEVKKPKVQKCVSAACVKPENMKKEEPEDPVNRIIEHYSEWNRLKRSVAWWIRLKKLLQLRAKDQHVSQSKCLTCEEIQEAENAICRHVQQSAFQKEISALSRHTKPDIATPGEEETTDCKDQCVPHDVNRLIPKTSGIVNLDPELHNGVLRVGGRLRNSHLPQNAKHQIILPKDHHVSTLIVKDVHEKVGHQGKNHVLAELRQTYWILNARATVKSILHKCNTCRRYQANSEKQKMADLPECRVVSQEPAFSRTGMDYFGPFETKQGRSSRKRYGVIFTCFNSRAIHIEIADCLDTSSCIDAIRRFTARRGSVKELYSDNGTNLVGAEKELRRALEELNQEQTSNFCANRGIQWHFNTPGESHHGGAWERQIRTIRKILSVLLQQQNMKSCRTDEQLRTLMCEVESIVNSRPLTRTSSDPDDLDLLRPQDLLIPQATTNYPPGLFNPKDVYAKKRWRQMQYLTDLFWKRWLKEYLPELQRRQRWLQPNRNIAVGDIVLIVDDHAPRCSWPMGKIIEVSRDNRGFVRSSQIKTKTSVLNRPITKLCLLLEQEA